MAATEFGTNHPATVKHWSDELFREALKATQAVKFMGTGPDALAQIRTDAKMEGDRIRMSLVTQLAGSGVTGDGILEGNEEGLSIYTDDIYIDQMRHAVRSKGRMSEQRVAFGFRETAKPLLRDWFADKIDYSFFNQLSGYTTETNTIKTGMQSPIAPSSGNVIMEATSTASLSTADTFGIRLVDYAIELARNATYPMRPCKLGGKDYYVMFIHDYQATDLRRSFSSGDWGDIQKAAISGGQTTGNPIFSGALGVYNNTIIHQTSRLPSTGVTNTRRAVFCGAQALGVAFGQGYSADNPVRWNEEVFDHGNQGAISGSLIWGCKKSQFNGTDLATVVIPTYAKAHTS